jgi:membrane protein implicated in regulation of membrane protease activity
MWTKTHIITLISLWSLNLIPAQAAIVVPISKQTSDDLAAAAYVLIPILIVGLGIFLAIAYVAARGRAQRLVGRLITVSSSIVAVRGEPLGTGHARIDGRMWEITGPECAAGSQVRIVRATAGKLFVEQATAGR